MNQTFTEIALAELIEHPENPRRGDVDAIADSIEHNGFYGAVIVQKSTNRILAGNHRARAAAARGMTSVPALVVDVDDAAARRILLADNRTNDLASYDEESLFKVLTAMKDEYGDLLGTGYPEEDGLDLIKATPKTPVESFPDIEAATERRIQYRCPSCGYEWSGNSAPVTAGKA